MIKRLRIIKYKRYQKWFCKQFVKQSNAKSEYEYLLKHYDKKSPKEAFTTVAIYDVLDNDGFRRLINALYRLKKRKKEFEVETYYYNRKSSKTNYIANNQTDCITGSVGTIKLKNNKWISEIDISFTYCNLSEVIIQYTFHFKRIMNTSVLCHRFVVEELSKAKKELYFHTFSNKNIIKKPNYHQLNECDEIFFIDILQAYICKWFYTKNGKRYQLPVEFCVTIGKYNSRIKRQLNNAFLFWCYEHKNKKEHLLVDDIRQERCIINHYITGNKFAFPMLLEYFSEYTMEMYYQTFNKIELHEIELHMRKYLNSNKRFVSSKDMKWLINKLRYIREQKGRIQRRIDKKDSYNLQKQNEWTLVLEGEKQSDKHFIMFPDYIEKFEEMYENNLEYLKSIATTQNDKVLIIVAVATLVATIAGILLSIFSIFYR